jgi:hypothetical protein
MFYEVLGNEPVAPTKRSAVQEILAENEAGSNLIVTSVITHLEVLPDKLGEKGADDEADYVALFDASKFAEIELSTNIILRAREIRNHYYRPADTPGIGSRMMDVGDALHLATATIFRVPEFHTRDNKSRKGNVPLLTLYKMYGETEICNKYPLNIVSPEAAQGQLILN